MRGVENVHGSRLKMVLLTHWHARACSFTQTPHIVYMPSRISFIVMFVYLCDGLVSDFIVKILNYFVIIYLLLLTGLISAVLLLIVADYW